MATINCEICGNDVVSTGIEGWFTCENEHCNMRYPVEWVRARYQTQEDWRTKGLCEYCGGNMSFWSDRCKDCGMQKG